MHVWRIDLDLDHRDEVLIREFLDPNEIARADRFFLPRARQDFIACRGTLRMLLARHLGSDPDAVSFLLSDLGKPQIRSGGRVGDLCFNLSRSSGKSLVAIAKCDVGIDIEWQGKSVDVDLLARTVFSDREFEEWRNLASKDRRVAFFDCWVRKEACVKAMGKGLAFPLNQAEVTMSPCEPPELLRLRGDRERARAWSMFDVDAGSEYSAALVARGAVNRIHVTDFQMKSALRLTR